VGLFKQAGQENEELGNRRKTGVDLSGSARVLLYLCAYTLGIVVSFQPLN